MNNSLVLVAQVFSFFVELLDGRFPFIVESVPIIYVFLLLKIFKLEVKVIAIILVIDFVHTIFFWIKINDLGFALFQSVAYISAFVWVWAERILEKRKCE